MRARAWAWSKAGMAVAAAAFLAAGASATHAEDAPAAPDPLATAVPLDDAALARERGGFEIAGMTISLGADLRTYIDGELALQTIISWHDNSVTRQEWVSAALTPATADQLRSGLVSNGGITLNMAGQSVYFANDGQTALMQRSDGGIQNIVLNTASHTAIQQQADISLDLSGYGGFQSALSGAALAGGINGTIADSAIGALH